MGEFDSIYDEANASTRINLSNGDYIWKITSVNTAYKTENMSNTAIRVGLSLYSDTEGNDLTRNKFGANLTYYRAKQGETEGQRTARLITLAQLKQLVFSVKGKALSSDEFEQTINNGSLINELVGARIAWIHRFNDRSKSNIAYDKFFKAEPVDGEYITFDGKAIGAFSETVLSKRIRDNLYVYGGETGRAYSPPSTGNPYSPASTFDDDIPF